MKRLLFISISTILTLLISYVQIGCGVKSKPLAPLREPWISKGDIEKDREKKYKSKKQPPAENKVEFETMPKPEDKKEL